MHRFTAVLLLSSVALAQAPPSQQVGDSAPEGVGSVERLQFTSLTRDVAQIWVRTQLPKVGKGWKQTFTGEVRAAGVAIPVRPPLTVAVQERPGRSEAVFAVDVRLADLPEELLTKVGTQAIDVEIQGTLEGEARTEAPVFAVGLLKYGTQDIETPRGSARDFIRLDAARLTGLSLIETTGEAKLVLYNPFSFAIPIRSLTYTLYAGDRRLCGGEKQSLRIHSRRETEVLLPLEARNADLLAVAGNAMIAGGTFDGRLVGAITLRVGKGDVTVPISAATKIELVR
ncbi:MAG TPA: LEA type 2 family protein [Thermoanaerobaculia bacterium]|nr:LEA type 2 family protein [Thermoanaerobaculia bacterium]